jgi:serine/threonine-protein phosphatase PGAM5
MATRKIYLIRHGEYDWQDRQSTDLTEIGVKQSRLTAQRIAALPVCAIYSSDLPRAVQTADIIRSALGDVTYRQDPGLRECWLPGLPFMSVPPEILRAGEKQAADSFAKYFLPARDRDEIEIIVSHGNLIRYLVARILGRPEEIWMRMHTMNCGISEVHVEADRQMWVVSYNDVGHIPPQLVTYGLPLGAYAPPSGA